MFDYLPQIIMGLIVLLFPLAFCRIIILVWRWLGLNFIFKPPLDPANMSEAIWMKTIPLLMYCVVIPLLLIVAFGIWDIKLISAPAIYYLGLLIGSPLLCIGLLITIAATHIALLKRANHKISG